MNKKFLTKVVLATVLVGGVNLLPVPNFDLGNVQISVAYAENKNFAAKEGAMTDVELIEAQAKEASRMRAIEAVKEKIASYVRNFSGANGKLTEDDIAAIAEKFEQVGETKYKKLFYNAVDEDGKELGKVGIMYEATVTAKFNSKKITEHIKLTEQEKAKRIRQAKEARAKFEELDREYEELRKNARTKTPEQLQSEIKDFDNKISDLEKSRGKNKSAKKDKPKTKQDKIQPMRFSNSVELGEFGWTDYGGFGVSIKKANSITEKPKVDSGVSVYSKGVARFGNGEDAIYLHYDKGGFKNGDTVVGFKVGGEDVVSAVAYDYFWTTISKVGVNNGYKMYLLKKSGNALRTIQYVLIGRRPDGKWVKYFDTEEMCKQYLGNSQNVSIPQVTMNGDTIIANYVRNQGSNVNESGEFRFKWDEGAKWFGVEKITYNQTPTEQKPAQENKLVTNQPMKFSQPVEIGWLGISQRNGAGGFMFKNETSNKGDYYTRYDKNNRYTYGKGLVKFGSDENSIYVHYDAYSKNKPEKFGSVDVNNTVEVAIFNTWIYRISTNNKIQIYAIGEFYGPDREFTIIGTKKDGKFVKYIDTINITKQYFGIDVKGGASPIVYGTIKCQSDTLILPYNNRRGTNGEFRFKWDEKAQWFSIEQIKY